MWWNIEYASVKKADQLNLNPLGHNEIIRTFPRWEISVNPEKILEEKSEKKKQLLFWQDRFGFDVCKFKVWVLNVDLIP